MLLLLAALVYVRYRMRSRPGASHFKHAGHSNKSNPLADQHYVSLAGPGRCDLCGNEDKNLKEVMTGPVKQKLCRECMELHYPRF